MTTLQATTINAAGLAEIAAFLAAHHKKGGEHFTPAMLRAWADDAEFQLAEGNSASIEIKSWDAVSGHAETYTVSDAGLAWAEVWQAWEDGHKDDAVRFLVPQSGTHDVAEAGANALGVEVSESLNVARM